MHTNIQYINLSWAVVGVCESRAMPLWKIIPAWCKDMADGIHHYIVGYLGFSPVMTKIYERKHAER